MDEPGSTTEAPLTDVAAQTPSLRTAHILFMDIVGFSKLRTNEQVAAQVELQRIVQDTEEVRLARMDSDGFVARPTGDGMALLFFRDQLSPIRCALQIHSSLKADAGGIKQRVGKHLQMRMGIHTGPVTPVIDLNGNEDAAGEGIIVAQRVMDTGDAEHILVSEDVARVLLRIDPWSRYLHDLGVVRVKHNQPIHLYNLVGRLDGPYLGNRSMPTRMEQDASARRREAIAARGGIGEILRPLKKVAIPVAILGGLFFANQKYDLVGQGQKKYAAWQKERAVAAQKAEKAEKQRQARLRAASGSGRTTIHPIPGGAPIVTGSGSSGVEAAPVPDLANLSYGSAVSAGKGDGFRVVRAGSEYSVDVEPGSVTRQSPQAGTMTKGTIRVWVSKGPKPEKPIVDEGGGSDQSSAPDKDESGDGSSDE